MTNDINAPRYKELMRLILASRGESYNISWRMHDVHIIAQEVVPSSK